MYPQTVCYSSLSDKVKLLPLKDQKDLAEDIIISLYELGWEIQWKYPNLTVSKTEEL